VSDTSDPDARLVDRIRARDTGAVTVESERVEAPTSDPVFVAALDT
jgi:hypothetical protein